jgi:hypothetical protein
MGSSGEATGHLCARVNGPAPAFTDAGLHVVFGDGDWDR